MSALETVALALLAVVQLLTLVIHQALSARRHKRALGELRTEIQSLRPPPRPRQRSPRAVCVCGHMRSDHTDAGPHPGDCNVCSCSAFYDADPTPR